MYFSKKYVVHLDTFKFYIKYQFYHAYALAHVHRQYMCTLARSEKRKIYEFNKPAFEIVYKNNNDYIVQQVLTTCKSYCMRYAIN